MAGRVWSLPQLRQGQATSRRPYHEVLRVEALSAGVYKLEAGASDPQAPHHEDEVYVVLAGTASVEFDGATKVVSAGSLVYVPKGLRHRFVDIVEDLEVLVLFAPPESG